MSRVIDYITDLGLDVVKDDICNAKMSYDIRKVLHEFIEKQEKINEVNYAAFDEEIDIEGLFAYVSQYLITDFKKYLFGTFDERERAKQTIVSKVRDFQK